MKSSEFLQKCCNGQWKESSTKTLKLPETDPGVFSAYLQFIYTGELVATDECHLHASKVESDKCSDQGSEEVKRNIAQRTFLALTKAAILADMLLDMTFGNTVVDEILKTQDALRFMPSPSNAAEVYSRIAGSSNVKRLMVDFYA